MSGDYVSISEAARAARMGRATIRRAVTEGHVASVEQTDGHRLVALADVQQLARTRRGGRGVDGAPDAAGESRPFLEERIRGIEESLNGIAARLDEALELVRCVSDASSRTDEALAELRETQRDRDVRPADRAAVPARFLRWLRLLFARLGR